VRCRACDYPLWGLDQRRCPECGAGFRPSQYEFTPNAVRFLCPHCRQQYFGTDERGHPRPRTFDCVSCGSRVDLDEMVLEPAEGVDARLTEAERNPWLEHERIGRARAWRRTWAMAAFRPGRLIEATPIDAPAGRAFAFGLWMWILTHLVAVAFVGLFMLLPALLGGGGGWGMLGAAAVMLAMILAGWAVASALWSALTHALLRLLGARPRAGIGRTYAAIAYASAGLWLAAIPCVSAWTYPIGVGWWIVGASVMVVRGQAVGAVRGTLAVVGPCLLVLGSGVGLVVWAILGAVGSVPGPAQPIASTLRGVAIVQGAPPDHAIDLLDRGLLPPEHFERTSGWPGAAGGADPPVGPTTPGRWLALPVPEREALARRIRDATPPGGPAQRVGNLVLTYWGVDLQSPQDPDLWLAIYSQHPHVAGDGPDPGWLVVIRADGAATRLPGADFGPSLSKQNRLRSRFGLPPLPDPRDVETLIAPPSPPPAG
jgi:hypothetical protein